MIRVWIFGLVLVAGARAEVIIPAGAKVFPYVFADTVDSGRAAKALRERKVPVEIVSGAEADYALAFGYTERESAPYYSYSGSSVCRGAFCSGSTTVKKHPGGGTGRYKFVECFLVDLRTERYVWHSKPVFYPRFPKNEGECVDAFARAIGQPLAVGDPANRRMPELAEFWRPPPPTPAQLADKAAAERMRVLREEIESLKAVRYTLKADPARLAELEAEFLALWEARAK